MKTLLASPWVRILLALNVLVGLLLLGRSLVSQRHDAQFRTEEERRLLGRIESAGMMRADDMSRLLRILDVSSKTRAFSDEDVDFLVDQIDHRAPHATEKADATRRVLVMFSLGSVGKGLTAGQRSRIAPALARLLVYRPDADRSVLSSAARLAARIEATSLAPALQDLKRSGDPALARVAETALQKLGTQ